ncbi:hypothetical protein [Nocardia sp. NPDC019395]|uniref:hypothetical protein n=1 Tax=Nocardia sp. NPDC019395 TaxID=3154686 RepID=UPI0033E73B6B
MTGELRYLDGTLLNFRDFEFGPGGSSNYQWVDIKVFRIVAAPDDPALLRSLIDTEQFRDGYIGAGVEPAGVVHGPYFREYISPDSYTRVSAGSVMDLVTTWVNNCGDVPESLWGAMNRSVFEPVRRADSLFRLRKLDPSAVVDYGPIHTEFHEVVTIDRTERIVRLIVAADD